MRTSTRPRVRSRRTAALAGTACLLIALSAAGCSGDSSDEPSDTPASDSAEPAPESAPASTEPAEPTDATEPEPVAGEFSLLTMPENTTVESVLTTLGAETCATELASAPLTSSSQPQESYDQQLQLLAGQDALPSIIFAANTPSLAVELNDGGYLVDISTALAEVGAAGAILPAAESVLRSLYGGQLFTLPAEFNIEGIWYNKQILADNGIDPPTTWAEFTDANATLLAAGVQPFSVAGAGGDGWNITRLVGNHIFRSLGPDAMSKVADGEAKLTDEGYVAGAQAIAEWGEAGYFGPAPTSVDYGTAMNAFLTGEAAFYYMGSWALAAFNDPEQNQIGADTIGFLPFPDVDGGAGSSDQVPANAGMPLALATAAYDDAAQAWLKCIGDNYGTVALRDHGQITGFQVTEELTDLPALTVEVQDIIANAPSSVLWFEALFSAEATTTSQTNAGLLAEGSTSAADFMELVQNDLG